MSAFLLSILLLLHSHQAIFIVKSPTNTMYSLMRGGPGAYGAPRDNGKTHAGVDIVANQSDSNKAIYSVFAVNDGTVAYAAMNGTLTTGYGYTIVIDHGDGNYSQYSHLAVNASAGIVGVGDKVTAGQLIGYMADLSTGEKSSGNVRADVVLSYDKIQLHLQCYFNKAGITPPNLAGFLANGGFLTDPTAQLQALGYGSF